MAQRKTSKAKSGKKRPKGNTAMLKKAHAIAKREHKLHPKTPYNKLVGQAMKSLAK